MKIHDITEKWEHAVNAEWDKDVPEKHQEILTQCLNKSSLGRHDLAVLYKFIKVFKPKNILEVGLATGSSAVCTVLSGGVSIKCYVMIDPFQCNNFKSLGIDAVRNNSSENTHLKLIEKFSYMALPELLLNNSSFDYAFIDGSHKFDDTLLEVFYIDKMLVEGGVMLLDDRPWPMVGAVVSFIQENYPHYHVDCTHPRLTLIYKIGQDLRRWYDFRVFDIPSSNAMKEKMEQYQSDYGSAFGRN